MAWLAHSEFLETLTFMLCLQVRVVLKYRHCDGNLCIKVTDNAVVSDAASSSTSCDHVFVCDSLVTDKWKLCSIYKMPFSFKVGCNTVLSFGIDADTNGAFPRLGFALLAFFPFPCVPRYS